MKQSAVELSLSAVIVTADQLTKWLVRSKIPLYDSVTVIPGLFDITHATNSGAAFGFLNGADFPYKSLVMVLVAIVALIAVGFYARTLPPGQWIARYGLVLVLGGACGNLIDRAMSGAVVDFIDVYWRSHHFWAFNIADSAITVGVIFVLLDLLLDVLRARRAPTTI